MTTTNTNTTTVAERFTTTENWAAREDAGILFTIVVETLTKDIEACIDTGRIHTLLRLASRLSGERYEALYDAAIELASNQRLISQRLWENRRGVAKHPRDAFNIPTPKHDAVERSLRF
jgi:hypothetical protein